MDTPPFNAPSPVENPDNAAPDADDGQAAETAAAASGAPETGIYDGLSWSEHPDAPALIGRSSLSGLGYLVDLRGPSAGTGPPQLWLAATPAGDLDPDDPDLPRLDLGTHLDALTAIDAAELHDFGFHEARALARGEEVLFQGSRRVAALDNDDLSILRAHAGPQVGGESATAPDGRGFSRAASFFTAKKTAYKQNADGSFTMNLTMDAEAVPVWLAGAAFGTQVFLGAVELREAEKSDSEERKRIKDLIRRASLRPGEGPFQEFLLRYDKWGLIRAAMRRDSDAVEEAAAETLRRLIGVPTRKELEVNRDARDRLERLDREYYETMARAVRTAEARHTT